MTTTTTPRGKTRRHQQQQQQQQHDRHSDFLALVERPPNRGEDAGVERELTYLRRRVEEMAKEIKHGKRGVARRGGEEDHDEAVAHIRKQSDDIGKLLRENQALRLKLETLEAQLEEARVSETDQREIALRSESDAVNLQAHLRISESRLEASVRRELALKSIVSDLQQRCDALRSRLDHYEGGKTTRNETTPPPHVVKQMESELTALRAANHEMMEVHATEVRQYEVRFAASEATRREVEWEKVEVECLNTDLEARLREAENKTADLMRELGEVRVRADADRDANKAMEEEMERMRQELKSRSTSVAASQLAVAMKALSRALPDVDAVLRAAEINMNDDGRRRERESACLSALLGAEEMASEGADRLDLSHVENQVRLAERLSSLASRARRVRSSAVDKLTVFEGEEDEEDEEAEEEKCVIS